jgi:hypothetical protein
LMVYGTMTRLAIDILFLHSPIVLGIYYNINIFNIIKNTTRVVNYLLSRIQ